MLDIRWARENIHVVEEALNKRGLELDLDKFLRLDSKRRDLLATVEKMKHRRNVVSEEIADLKKSGEPAEEKIAATRSLSKEIKELDAEVAETEQALNLIMLELPNIPDQTVPVGDDESANVVVRTWGDKPEFDFEPLTHWDIGEALGVLDFARAAKIARSRFVLYWNLGARLERALVNFMLDLHIKEHGYMEIFPPVLVNDSSLTATGNLPKFSEDLFKIQGENLYLIPTAEVPITNIHRGEILAGEELPLKYAAYTPCFRSEAGAYGKETRGLIRHHQFNKVELVKFARPETSDNELEALTMNAEEVLKRLGLHYRTVALATGDLGFASAKTYDLEVWLPGFNGYKEISSCSNFTNFQARRGDIRWREKPGAKSEFVHTLNGSGLAIGRTVAAILENYQREDGSVVIPEVLRPYIGEEVIPAKER